MAAEKRWRANLLSDTVDEIEIVNETDQYVDVQHPPSGGWAAKVRREAKVTAYSRVCKSPADAWAAIAAYAKEQLAAAESAVNRWGHAVALAENHIAKSAD
jgi:hypothetical protein